MESSTLLGGTQSSGHVGSETYADWCYSHPSLLAETCRSFVEAPLWTSVCVADCVAVWFIICIFWRQLEQWREKAQLRDEWMRLPLQHRGRRLWQRLSALIRIRAISSTVNVRHEAVAPLPVTMVTARPRDLDSGEGAAGAAETSAGDAPRGAESWHVRWERFLRVRKDRKEYLLAGDFDVVGVILRGMGPCFILAISALILFEVHAFYAIALPWLNLWSWLDTLISLLAAALFGKLFVDYARTSFTDPGRPGTQSDAGVAAAEELDSYVANDIELGPSQQSKLFATATRKCVRCRGSKPFRCHHCRVCRRCVLRMDHHCPFVNNCVGLRNYPTFCMFLLDVVASCFIVALSLIPQLPGIVLRASGATFPRQVHVLAAIILAVVPLGLVGSLFSFNIFLILSDQTMLEHMSKTRSDVPRGPGETRSPFALDAHFVGSNALLIDNVYRVFGAPPIVLQRLLEAVIARMLPGHPVLKRSV
eukprot:TRINITY_DN10689_c0_g1_i1.p1 TRINITY_DN10689_c0_g1~~TRINITY_DN10689_c0_g1_i1.p1  ORF type:complete len:491 (-),score=32.05 TRINITY_DN10689_c0_g1_i1:42-1475(-)